MLVDFSWEEPIAQDFPYMVKFGMSPLEALRSDDRSSSRDAGDVRPDWRHCSGAYADIIAVEGDPLKNIEALENVTFVMKEGQVYKSPMRVRACTEKPETLRAMAAKYVRKQLCHPERSRRDL